MLFRFGWGLGVVAALLAGALLGCAATPPTAPTIVPAARASTTSDTASSSRSSAPAPVAKHKDPKDANETAYVAKSFDEAVGRGDAAWQNEDGDYAIYLYVQALAYRPRDVNTLGKMGTIELARGNLDLAANAFEIAAQADPADARVTGRLGLVLAALQKERQARPWLEKCVQAGSDDWRVYDALGVAEGHQGSAEPARLHLQRAAQLAPESGAPVLHLAQLEFSQGGDAQAESSLTDLVIIHPSAEAWRLLGRLQAKHGAYGGAAESLLHVIDAAAAYNLVGEMALQRHDNGKALEYFEKAGLASPVYYADAERNAAIARERIGTGAR